MTNYESSVACPPFRCDHHSMRPMLRLLVVAALLLAFLPGAASAHPGNTDSSGGHTCRTNCASWGYSTGQYHYHNRSTAASTTSDDFLGAALPYIVIGGIVLLLIYSSKKK